MNRTHAQSFVDVLAFAGEMSESRDRLGQLREADWETSLRWLDQSGLTLYLWQRVQEMGLQDAIPREVRAKCVERQSQNSIRTQAMLQEWRNLQRVFRAGGLDCVVLKGLSKVPDYCPDPSLRVQFDHDWLIEKESLSRAHALLCAAGFRQKPIREKDRVIYLRSAVPQGRRWQPADSYSAALQRPVELHIELWDSLNEVVPLTIPEGFFARRVKWNWGRDEFHTLSEVDLLLFEALHAFRHVIHSWCRLSVFYEIANFLNQRFEDKDFWLRFRAQIDGDLRLRQGVGIVLSLAASLFKVPEFVRALPGGFFQLTPALRMWVERYGIQSAIRNFATDKFNLFLIGEFVDNRRRWSSLRRQRMFPLGQFLRPRGAAAKQDCGGLTARVRRGLILAGRIGSHLYGSTLYALEYPRWKFLTRHQLRKGLSSVPVASSLKDAQQPDFAASRLQGGNSIRAVRG